MSEKNLEHAQALLASGVIDMHFDLGMDLYDQRQRSDVLRHDHLAKMRAGNMRLVASAIYLEDKYLPEMALRAGLGQVARMIEETARCPDFMICKSYQDLQIAQQTNKIGLFITMEGVEPLGSDLDLLTVFYALGLRSLGLTHTRRNTAGEGGVFAASGSSPQGLTKFGRAVVEKCEALGIIVDLAHLNPAGVADVLAMCKRPVIISHTNARRFYDIERNNSDADFRAVAACGGVIGVNAVLVSPEKAKTTLDHFVDHIAHIVNVAGIEAVGLGFDFFEFIWQREPAEVKAAMANSLAPLHFIPDLTHHGHTLNLVCKLIERGFSDAAIEKILIGNWQRILKMNG